MARREYRHALADMREAIEGILRATADKTLADYRQDWVLRHAVQRAIEIISEASRAVPDADKAKRPEIPWPQVRASATSCAMSIPAFPIR